ncbi:hypothetical protein K0U00_51100, partial [Paenibacillus sepulcri]|nr:hypothetical protein [Paenibacillus sepulcri]
MTLFNEEIQPSSLLPGQEAVFRLAVVLSASGEACATPDDLSRWERRTEAVWQERVDRMCESIPR